MELKELYQTFFDEADELLNDMEQSLMTLDPAAPEPERLDAIFRAAHSIKGGAGAFGFSVLQETTHLLENLLDRARRREIALERATVDVLLETRDRLKDQISAYRDGGAPDAKTYQAICATLRRLAEDAPAAAASEPEPAPAEPNAAARTLDVRIRGVAAKERAPLVDELALLGDITARADRDDELAVTLRSTEAAADIESVLCFIVDAEQVLITPVAAESVAEPAAAPPARTTPEPAGEGDPAPDGGDRAGRAAGSGRHADSASLRVATDKIDRIINLVGELVITQSMLEQTAAQIAGRAHGALAENMAQLRRNARDLQEAVMSIRMMPMDYVFSRFPRLVRDLSHKLGKEVELEILGAAAELDKGVIERILDPLTHLVRNSLDHGIETPAARAAAGKPRAGRLTLAARHQGGHIVIEICDDGTGLSRERILAKARAGGLAVADTMADDDVWQLIFAPGFSTAESITDVSGRGVGMDVVKRNIVALGGRVRLRSAAGAGTAVSIVLPLTLAIMEGMSVQVGAETFIVPVGAIVECLQMQDEQIHPVSAGERVVRARGEYLPLVALHRVFAVPGAQADPTRGIVMVVQSENQRFALLVDALIGQHQVVVKNLETHFRKVPGVSAATILGDGSVALIVDVVALSRGRGQSRSPTADTLPQEVVS